MTYYADKLSDFRIPLNRHSKLASIAMLYKRHQYKKWKSFPLFNLRQNTISKISMLYIAISFSTQSSKACFYCNALKLHQQNQLESFSLFKLKTKYNLCLSILKQYSPNLYSAFQIYYQVYISVKSPPKIPTNEYYSQPPPK